MSNKIKWNMSIPWEKKSDYILRCIEESFAPSNSSGNPMVTLKFEVAGPDDVEGSNGQVIVVAGISPLTHYCPIKSLNGTPKATAEEATETYHENYKKLLANFDLPIDDIDWDNPKMGFKGKLVYALVEDEEKEQRGSPTKADLAKGIKVGPVLMHPKTKLPLITHYPKIREFYGIAELAGAGSL